jgi:hypothetical protein
VSLLEPGDPVGGGGEQHLVAGMAGGDAQRSRDMGLSIAGPRKTTLRAWAR